jgi:hypothetical protein
VKTDALLAFELITMIVLSVIAFEVFGLLGACRIARKRMSANGFDASKLTERLRQTRGSSYLINHDQRRSRPRNSERAQFVRQVRDLAYSCERNSGPNGDDVEEERN